MKASDSAIRAYQKRCFREYKSWIGLPDNYTYLYGNPVNVLVPVETAINGLMIVGAYPSAKFFTVNGIPDVPLVDNDSPFSNEIYFDGSRVRSIPSGKELEENYLAPFNIRRKQCWITDLVKVFLFKPGHLKRYQSLGNTCIYETRSRYQEFAEKSKVWLETEIKLARPKAVILLGVEVVSILLGVSEKAAKDCLDGKIRLLQMGEETSNAICLPHPGILMRSDPRNPWPERFRNEIRPIASENLRELDL